MAGTYLFGASGHGKVVKEILNANGVEVEAFVDDNKDVDECAGRPVLHDATALTPMIVSIGVNRIRRTVVERLRANAMASHQPLAFVTAIHPSAIVSPTARIGEGTVVMAGAIINADVKIGKHCIVNTGVSIDHDCVIEDFCHIAPGAHISGGTHVGEGTWIGVGTSVIQCLRIGKDCMIGAGSVVVNNIPDGVTAFGNPCRVRNYNHQDSTMKKNVQTPSWGGKTVVFSPKSNEERRVRYAA